MNESSIIALLIFLLCLFPLLAVSWLFSLNWKRKKETLSFLAPLLERAGFEPISPLKYIINRDNALYRTAQDRFLVSLEMESIGEGERLVNLVCFHVFLSHPYNFLICSPSLNKHTGNLLYEVYWDKVSLNTLAPLGIKVICDRKNASRIHKSLEHPIFQRIFTPLLRNGDSFYILSNSSQFFKIAFVIQSPSAQRGAYWLQFVRDFSEAWSRL